MYGIDYTSLRLNKKEIARKIFVIFLQKNPFQTIENCFK